MLLHKEGRKDRAAAAAALLNSRLLSSLSFREYKVHVLLSMYNSSTLLYCTVYCRCGEVKYFREGCSVQDISAFKILCIHCSTLPVLL